MRPIIGAGAPFDYFIEKERLGEVRMGTDRSDWLLHLSEDKGWLDLEDFILAWQTAVYMHDVDVSHLDVPGSIAQARWEVEQNKIFNAEYERLDPRAGRTFREVDFDVCAKAWNISHEWEGTHPRP